MGFTRFAPAPTGLLHLGHVVNAIYVWGLGARLGARVLLRIEDHDRVRSRREFEAMLLDDLDWLGFSPHLFPTSEFRGVVCVSRQSDRGLIYTEQAAALRARGLVYGCRCTRRDVTRAQLEAGSGGGYPGTCRDLGIAADDTTAWRVNLRGAAEVESFDDLLAGPVVSPASQGGDPVIRDREGNWTYQFAATVDDFLQDVDLVIRGRDLIESTVLQVRLAHLIGRGVAPRFAHHPLVMKSPSQKLSKSDGATGIRALREAGRTPSQVIGHAAFLAGLAEPSRSIEATQVTSLFP